MRTLGRPFAGLGRLLTAAIAAGCLFGGVAFAQQDNIDPGDIWFRAYSLLQEGEKAKTGGNLLEAFNKYAESKPLFDGLARDYPDFYPDLVRYRRQQLIEIIDQLKQRMRKSPGEQTNAPREPQPDAGAGFSLPGNGTTDLRPTSPEFMDEGPGSSGLAMPQWNSNSPQPGDRAGGSTQNQRQPNEVVRPPGGAPDDSGSGYPLPSTGDTETPVSPLLQIQSKFDQMRSEIDTLKLRSSALEKDLLAKQKRIDQVQGELAEAQRRAADLNRQREQAQAEAVQYAQAAQNVKAVEGARTDAEKNRADSEAARADREAARSAKLEADVKKLDGLLAEALSELESANQRNKAMLAELETTKREMEQLRLEKDQVEKERNQLAAIVESSGENTRVIAQLTEDNQRLRDELTKARQMAEGLATEKSEKSAEIALLKEKIEKIDAERQQLQADNQRYEKDIAELQEKLQELGRQASEPTAVQVAAAGDPVMPSPQLTEENELLRTVVLKQLRRQNQIKRTKDILLQQLDKLGGEAKTLIALVDDMATGTTLTEEERGLFKTPEVRELADAFSDEKVGPRAILVEGAESDGSGDGILQVQNISDELVQLQKAARLDFQEGRYADAEKNYRKYLEFRPQSVVCLCNLALVKITAKSYKEAVELLERAVALKGDYGLAYYLIGRTFYEEGRLDEALEKLNLGIQYDPDNPKAHNCIGVISSQKGFIKRAEEAFILAVKIDPDYADAHFNLAVLFATREDPDVARAEEHYLRAIHLGIPRDAAIENFINTARLGTATVGMR